MAVILSRRCSPCNANWPNASAWHRCPECGEMTWGCDMPADRTAEQANRAMEKRQAWSLPDEASIAGPLPEGSAGAAYLHRIECYLELGFTHLEAHLLAEAKSSSQTTSKTGEKLSWRTPLHHAKVKAALDAGLSRADAVELFT